MQADYQNNVKSLLMTLVYGVTTPLGVAIGIFMHSSFNPNSVDSLLVEGIFTSSSGGILIYTSLVELLAPEITSSPDFRKLSFGKQFILFFAVWSGAASMSIIGKFA